MEGGRLIGGRLIEVGLYRARLSENYAMPSVCLYFFEQLFRKNESIASFLCGADIFYCFVNV